MYANYSFMSRLVKTIPILALILAGCSMQLPSTTTTAALPLQRLTIGQTPLTVEVASTITQKQQGLSGRASLPEGRGMLFTFDQPGPYSFWMKDMNFALDFIWLQRGTVVEMEQNVPPPTSANP